MFAPGDKGIVISVLIVAAYGVHPDGKSHTGSCVVIRERGAVHCKSAKQQIVTKSITEAELVALSDSSNQALYLRNFVIGQGHLCGPVTVYQDNMSCMSGRLNTRCHLLAFAAKVEKQLQATVSNQ